MSQTSVLVIEDNQLNMKLVKALLNIGKYRILEAKDAATGIRLAFEELPALILMDIQLPDMDGLRATRYLKNCPETRGIPVVALTSYVMAADEKNAYEAGCIGFIPKPIDTKTFLEDIAAYLSDNGMAAKN